MAITIAFAVITLALNNNCSDARYVLFSGSKHPFLRTVENKMATNKFITNISNY